MIETLNIQPAKTPDELQGITRQMIDPTAAGRLIQKNIKIKCENRLKAVLLKGAIDQEVYDYTLATMEALKFTPSRRKSVKQSKIGRDLILPRPANSASRY
jgi:dTDP-4-dehydrorhamnose reductase